MTRLNERPIIFALSNPTDHAECTAEEAYRWSKGKALYAAGVQFPPVRYGGKTLPARAGQQLLHLPGGRHGRSTPRRRKRVTDEMFIDAAHAVADQVTQGELDSGLLYPPQSNILRTEIAVAAKVAEYHLRPGPGRRRTTRDVRQFVEGQLYKPEYTSISKER